jgi:hypothetical protein
MATGMGVPSIDDVDRISDCAVPALGNLQITHCYHGRSALFDPPFTDKQVGELKAGWRSAGPLYESSLRRALDPRQGPAPSVRVQSNRSKAGP